MASANIKTVTVKTVELTLTEDEAKALRDIIYWGIAGTGRREIFDNIENALRYAGVNLSFASGSNKRDFSGTITFVEPKK